MQKYKFVVVGGGTAGIIAATLLEAKYGNKAEVVLLYDHSKPGIGVGESLTPIFISYLHTIGITEQELVKNVNATFKLAMKFDNWKGDGTSFFHTFSNMGRKVHKDQTGIFEVCMGGYPNTPIHHYLENNKIPNDISAGDFQHSMHIDATKFSVYVEEKFKDKLTIIDGDVVDVIREGEDIKFLQLKDGTKVDGDFFIDATGFQSILFNKLNADWIDMSDWLPINSFIPNPVPWEFDEIKPYTTSEATDDGWILQVPLQNRWGSGFLFCDEFTTEDEAFTRFSKWVKNKYDRDLTNTSKVMHFKSGYWKQQWVGNCIAVGLCSGFAEPLEATNIHHTITQMFHFTKFFNLNILDYDRDFYNKIMVDMYNNIYLYIRYCYTGRKTDSKFWDYMSNNTPKVVEDLKQKVMLDAFGIHLQSFGLSPMFDIKNFIVIGDGLDMLDRERIIINGQSHIVTPNLVEAVEKIQSSYPKDCVAPISTSHIEMIERIKNA